VKKKRERREKPQDAYVVAANGRETRLRFYGFPKLGTDRVNEGLVNETLKTIFDEAVLCICEPITIKLHKEPASPTGMTAKVAHRDPDCPGKPTLPPEFTRLMRAYADLTNGEIPCRDICIPASETPDGREIQIHLCRIPKTEIEEDGFVERLNEVINIPVIRADAPACTCVPLCINVTKEGDLTGALAGAGELVDIGLTPGSSAAGVSAALLHQDENCPLWGVGKAVQHAAGRLSPLERFEKALDNVPPPRHVYSFSCQGCGQSLLLQVWPDGLEAVSPAYNPRVHLPPKLPILPLPESSPYASAVCPQCEEEHGPSEG
jgi:hypothetical protein